MKLVIFGLTISSSWGNGHATLWRGLCKALARRGHDVVFFERDVPHYASHRDLTELAYGQLHLYPAWSDAAALARRELAGADVVIVTSYCPDAIEAMDTAMNSPTRLRVFYDLDTPVTLERLRSCEPVPYIGPRGLADYDLVLSYTGGGALDELHLRLGAQRVAPLYGSVDPEAHHPVEPVVQYRADLSYLGTYAADRQAALDELFVTPARRRPKQRFVIAGAQYPQDFPWAKNIDFVQHLPPSEHSAFYSSSRLTLNVTRQAMAAMGYCPSGRLFEAAACSAALVSDWWEGLDQFLTPGSEVLVARCEQDVMAAMDLSHSELARIGRAARERTLAEHTALQRAREFENVIEAAASTRSMPGRAVVSSHRGPPVGVRRSV